MAKELDFGAFQDGDVQDTGASDANRTEAGTETNEVSTDAETHEDTELAALFAGSEDEDGGEDSGLFSEETAGDEGDSEAASRNAQLARLRKQRHDLRSETQTLKERLSSTEAALESAKALGDAITQRYQNHANPAAAVGFDADFMDAAERVAQADPEVMRSMQKVRQAMEGKTFDTPVTAAQPQADDTTKELRNEIQALRQERQAEKVEEFVTGLGVKPSMVPTVVKEVMGRLDGSLTREGVKSAILAASSDLGWTPTDITNVKPAEKKKDAPDGGKPRAAAVSGAGKEEAESEKAPAKDLNEWHSNREALFQSVDG